MTAGTIALLAAGGSSRMRGGDKLLETIGGTALLRLLAIRALVAGWPVAVTLPPGQSPRRAALRGLPLDLLDVPDAATGMAASFRRLSALQAPLLVMLADMPEIETADLRRLIAAHAAAPDRVVRATAASGRGGQPVLFPARLVPALAGLAGDEGARRLLAGEEVVAVPLPGDRAVTDLDTPEAWAEWRARTGCAP